MASNLQGKSPVRKDSALNPIPLNSMHTSTADFFRWHVAKLVCCVPRDIINFNCDTFVQGAPNPFPINGSMTYGLHAFFIPYRLLWKDWKFYYTDLQSGLTKPYFTLGDLWDVFNDSSSPYLDPYLRAASMKFLSDIDNFSSVVHFIDYPNKTDIPVGYRNLKLTAMPLRAAQLVWFDWMRDKMHISDNAKSSYCFDTGGHISLAELTLLCQPKFRNFPKNMFTAAYDDPQEGATANVLGNIPSSSENPGFGTTQNPASVQVSANSTAVGKNVSVGNSVISSASINELRLKNSFQQYKERLLVSGKTVISRCLALLGVAPTIEELQMSNWLGGRDFDLDFNTFQTSSSTRNSQTAFNGQAGSFGYDPRQQNIAGQKGQDVVSSPGMGLKEITYKTDESGYFLVFGCVTPNVQYYQGLPKNWTAGLDTLNSDKFDEFHSDFENQPFEPVLNYEVCVDDNITPKNVFGFQNMYSRYKQAFDSLGGDYILARSNSLLSSMHLGRDIGRLVNALASDAGSTDVDSFLTPANLRQSSYYDASYYDQKFTISDSTLDHFQVNHKFSINMLRPMQLFCLPSLDPVLSKVTEKDLIDTGGFSV